jgi:hypothetical protein
MHKNLKATSFANLTSPSNDKQKFVNDKKQIY